MPTSPFSTPSGPSASDFNYMSPLASPKTSNPPKSDISNPWSFLDVSEEPLEEQVRKLAETN